MVLDIELGLSLQIARLEIMHAQLHTYLSHLL